MPSLEARSERAERTRESKNATSAVEQTSRRREREREKEQKEQKEQSVAPAAPTTTTASNSKREIYYAPESAIETIVPFVKDYKTVWDPASGPSENFPLKDMLESQGHRVVLSDILMGKEYDFFSYKTKKRYDIIITTPPYSLRKEFVLRALDLKKPFAFFVPTNVVESKTIRDAFKQHNVSLIYPAKNSSFLSPEDSRSVKSLPQCMWVVFGVPKLSPIIYL